MVKRSVQAYRRGDIDAFLEEVGDDVEFDFSGVRGPYRGVYRGREGARELFAAFWDAWVPCRYDHRRCVREERKQVRVRQVRVRLLAGIVTMGFVLATTACGDDGNVATTTTEVPKAPESASGKAAATPAETPEELASCLEKAGYTTAVIPAPPEGAPGADFGSIGSVRVEVSRDNGVVAVFFENAKQAKELSKEGALTPPGATEVVGTVFLAANQGRPQELEAFRTCLKG